MVNRAGDWLAQADRDLRHAESSRNAEEHEWACFAAHQAAEKAVKGLHLTRGQEAWGHVVARLLRELPLEVEPLLVEKAKVLDNAYVPARYPNGHPEGAPFGLAVVAARLDTPTPAGGRPRVGSSPGDGGGAPPSACNPPTPS